MRLGGSLIACLGEVLDADPPLQLERPPTNTPMPDSA